MISALTPHSHSGTLSLLFAINDQLLMINELIVSLYPSNMTTHSHNEDIYLSLVSISHLFLIMMSLELLIAQLTSYIAHAQILTCSHTQVLNC